MNNKGLFIKKQSIYRFTVACLVHVGDVKGAINRIEEHFFFLLNFFAIRFESLSEKKLKEREERISKDKKKLIITI